LKNAKKGNAILEFKDESLEEVVGKVIRVESD